MVPTSLGRRGRPCLPTRPDSTMSSYILLNSGLYDGNQGWNHLLVSL